jgi:hypothetical protein
MASLIRFVGMVFRDMNDTWASEFNSFDERLSSQATSTKKSGWQEREARNVGKASGRNLLAA